MLMVADSNILKDETLREYLSTSRKNKVVITDYVMIEALKDDPLRKIFGLMKILREFPKQVVVLKSMSSNSQLKGRRCGMTRRMIDWRQSKGFGDWCTGLAKAEAGDEHYRDQLIESGKAATAIMARILDSQRTYSEVIAQEAKKFTQEELRILRTDEPYTAEMHAKIAQRIVDLTAGFIEAHPEKIHSPTVWQLPYTFLFRFALCAYLQTLRRIRDGGAQEITAEKIANDVVDATFATYATYFQGLLSKDSKANELYRNAKHVLKGFPVSPSALAKSADDKLAPRQKT